MADMGHSLRFDRVRAVSGPPPIASECALHDRPTGPDARTANDQGDQSFARRLTSSGR
jgi:hypothetical protein